MNRKHTPPLTHADNLNCWLFIGLGMLLLITLIIAFWDFFPDITARWEAYNSAPIQQDTVFR